MSRRKSKAHIPAKEKLAAALLESMRPDEHGNWVRVISHAEAQMMTADQIISLFQFHHDPIAEEDGGPAEAWNLTPTLIKAHRKISGKQRTQSAKDRRIAEANARHAERMAENRRAILAAPASPPTRARRQAVMPGSRASPYKRKFNGKTELRPTGD